MHRMQGSRPNIPQENLVLEILPEKHLQSECDSIAPRCFEKKRTRGRNAKAGPGLQCLAKPPDTEEEMPIPSW